MAVAQNRNGVPSQRWERFASAGGLGFLLTIALGAALVGEAPPASKAPASEIAAYFAEHRAGQLRNSALVVLGAFALYPWFLARLYRVIGRHEGGGGMLAPVSLIAGIALLAPLLLQAGGWGAAALEAGAERDAAVATALMDLGNMGFLFIPIPAALLMAVSSLAALSTAIFPRWLAQAGLTVAVFVMVGGVLGFLPQIMFALFALWLAGVSIALMRRQEAE
jgi:hypothetical protein